MNTSKLIFTGIGVLALTVWLMAGEASIRTNATATKVCAASRAHTVTGALARAAAKVAKRCQTNEWQGSNAVGRTRGTELWPAVTTSTRGTELWPAVTTNTTGAAPPVRTRGVELWEKQ